MKIEATSGTISSGRRNLVGLNNNIVNKLYKGGMININLTKFDEQEEEDKDGIKTLYHLSTKSPPIYKTSDGGITFNFWKSKIQHIHKFLCNPYAIKLTELHFQYDGGIIKPKMTPLFGKALGNFIACKVSKEVSVGSFTTTTAQFSALIGAGRYLTTGCLVNNKICDKAILHFPTLRVVNECEETLEDYKSGLKHLLISSNTLHKLDLQSFCDNGYAANLRTFNFEKNFSEHNENMYKQEIARMSNWITY